MQEPSLSLTDLFLKFSLPNLIQSLKLFTVNMPDINASHGGSDLRSVFFTLLDQLINKEHDSHPGFPLSWGRPAGPIGQKTSAVRDSETAAV